MCPYRLLSVHKTLISIAHRWFAWMPRGRVSTNEIMLDSGAFTAWSKGTKQSLDSVVASYDGILEKYGDLVRQWWFINLDVIPGSKGSPATPEQMHQAMCESDHNFEKLRARYGERVLPVYHQFEPASRLKDVASQNPNYICISPQNDVAEPLRVKFSKSAHQALKQINAITKTHGLATTGMRMMTIVPWFSADSTAWMMSAALGGILFFNGKTFVKVDMSERDIEKKPTVNRQHWRFIPKSLREMIAAEAATRLMTVDDLRDSYAARSAFNMETLINSIGDLQRFDLADQGDVFGHGDDLTSPT